MKWVVVTTNPNGWLTAKSRHTTMPLAMGFWDSKDDAVQASTQVMGPAGIEMTAVEMTALAEQIRPGFTAEAERVTAVQKRRMRK